MFGCSGRQTDKMGPEKDTVGVECGTKRCDGRLEEYAAGSFFPVI